jgi:hypothetical protein
MQIADSPAAVTALVWSRGSVVSGLEWDVGYCVTRRVGKTDRRNREGCVKGYLLCSTKRYHESGKATLSRRFVIVVSEPVVIFGLWF